MAENSEVKPGIAVLRAFIFALVWLFFAGALVTSARVGILMAREDLPAAETSASDFAAGVVVTIDGSDRPVPFAENARALREHYFRLGSGGTGMDSAPGIEEFSGAVKARTLQQDLDLVKVEILSGDGAGRQIWVRRELLPDPVPADGQ